MDDESGIRMAMSRFFAREGWDVVEASDGHAACRLLGPGAGHVDLVICDLRMPKVSGADLYRWLTAQRPEMVERLVFTTGDILCQESVAFLAQARRPVLEKPFDLADLARIAEHARAASRLA